MVAESEGDLQYGTPADSPMRDADFVPADTAVDRITPGDVVSVRFVNGESEWVEISECPVVLSTPGSFRIEVEETALAIRQNGDIDRIDKTSTCVGASAQARRENTLTEFMTDGGTVETGGLCE